MLCNKHALYKDLHNLNQVDKQGSWGLENHQDKQQRPEKEDRAGGRGKTKAKGSHSPGASLQVISKRLHHRLGTIDKLRSNKVVLEQQ